VINDESFWCGIFFYADDVTGIFWNLLEEVIYP